VERSQSQGIWQQNGEAILVLNKQGARSNKQEEAEIIFIMSF
jgi:hypothetical protein